MKIHRWLDEFKLALIDEDSARLEGLLDELDLKEFLKNQSEEGNLKEGLSEILPQIEAFLKEASTLLSAKKESQALEIQKIQKALNYIKA
ncbi:MAG: hypothetical protein Q4A73_02060 [Campylobacter sp.]|nr:hypothetical protein [Campylobacter sp.]MDO4673932.1 hypothetical protein [Campylobacter sp.]